MFFFSVYKIQTEEQEKFCCLDQLCWLISIYMSGSIVLCSLFQLFFFLFALVHFSSLTSYDFSSLFFYVRYQCGWIKKFNKVMVSQIF